ncbi:DUF1501 domain-containing protein [Pontiellaceae bacterium B12227]|nr:DUF1501 domain-containing protein [Pontiellaceae bacterium B12227]
MNTRRKFFQQAGASAAMGSALFSLKMTAGAASGESFTDHKALVCLFLLGGNDSFNMLVPTDPTAYGEYTTVRGGLYDSTSNPTGLALNSTGELLPISDAAQPYSSGFGIHHKLPILQTLYNAGNCAFVSNVGTLIEPTTLAQYQAKSTALPVGLFSHADEQVHWQTVVPQIRGTSPKGWAGRMADCLTQANLNSTVGMNISVSGNNTMQVGPASIPYITDPSGVVLLKTKYNETASITNAVDSILAQQYGNLYQTKLATSNRSAIDTAAAFSNAISPYDFSTDFSTTQTGKKLRNVAELLAAKDNLSMNRQVFFVSRGGWDHHNEVINAQENLFTEVNEAITDFWNKLVELGIQNDVVLFTATDFGRTLTSNGRGSDHAWGGNAFVIGGDVAGGKIYGEYPVLASGGPLDVGRARLLPTTSIDEYCAEMASWFGVPPAELSTVFPNIGNFLDPFSTPHPLGILG